jgi:hypothetical protein
MKEIKIKEFLQKFEDVGFIVDINFSMMSISIDFKNVSFNLVEYKQNLFGLDEYLESIGYRTSFRIEGYSLITVDRYGKYERRNFKIELQDIISSITDKYYHGRERRWLESGLIDGYIKIEKLIIILSTEKKFIPCE